MLKIPYDQAVREQPGALRAALSAARAGMDGLPGPAGRPDALLTVCAMGASTNASEALVHAARAQGRVVLNPAASVWSADVRPPGGWALAISESGRSPEPIAALRLFEGPTAALTNVPGSPISRVADATVSMGGFADSGVYVTGYTATLAALGILGRHMGLTGTADALDEVPDAVEQLLDSAPGQLSALLDRPARPTVVDVVAGPASLSSASELALLLREAARLPSTAHLTDQYLHGPVESLNPNALLVLIGDDTGGLIERFDAEMSILHITASASPARHQVRIPPFPAFASTILEAVVAQHVALTLTDGTFAIGEFRHEFDGTKLPDGDH